MSTLSIETCKTNLDVENAFTLQTKVRKTSRTSEEVIGNCTLPNNVKIVKVNKKTKIIYYIAIIIYSDNITYIFRVW